MGKRLALNPRTPALHSLICSVLRAMDSLELPGSFGMTELVSDLSSKLRLLRTGHTGVAALSTRGWLRHTACASCADLVACHCCAQAHGSNVMGIETTAVFDPATQARLQPAGACQPRRHLSRGNYWLMHGAAQLSLAGASGIGISRQAPLFCCVFLQEFVLNTPNNEASKFWIGGVAQTARICAIFAQVRRCWVVSRQIAAAHGAW